MDIHLKTLIVFCTLYVITHISNLNVVDLFLSYYFWIKIVNFILETMNNNRLANGNSLTVCVCVYTVMCRVHHVLPSFYGHLVGFCKCPIRFVYMRGKGFIYYGPDLCLSVVELVWFCISPNSPLSFNTLQSYKVGLEPPS